MAGRLPSASSRNSGGSIASGRYGPAMASDPDHDSEIGAAPAMIARMQADLLDARKRRDAVATSALRTAMAAISNAEAPALGTVDASSAAIGSGPTGELVDHR